MVDLDDVAKLAAANGHLAVVSTVRADGTVQASLVSAGVSKHPVAGRPVLAFVAAGRVKLANLRARPVISATFHHGGTWATVEGIAKLAGPDDTGLGPSRGQLTALLRTIFTDAGGTHDDWPTYDRTMLRERRADVLIEPTRIYANLIDSVLE
jgi:PPOX class probable F420-dependent enzyme